MKLDNESKFLSGLIELQYGQAVEKKLKEFSEGVSWAQGWPENKKAFWNAEAFMWERKISREKRELIATELRFLEEGRNLDLGCGAYSYIKSVGFDLSSKMLQFNDNLVEKIKGDLEKELPFVEGSFDSVTAVFLFNYVRNYRELLLEIKRILDSEGVLVIVLFSKQINPWQRQKEVYDFGVEEWKEEIKTAVFKVDFYQKEELLFFKAVKR
ncbi:MAG: class I SAM-dependent methyltransferase [Nanoarchaeota archaeon]|nr:class I SAM-dependent methyltransferase [Nanoarchaeota archaeon]